METVMRHWTGWIAVFCLLGVVVFPGRLFAESFEEVLKNFIDTAVQNHPLLGEADQHINALNEIPAQVSSLEDPVLEFGLYNLPTNSFAFDQEAMTQKKVVVSQMFPFPGKLGLKELSAEKDVEMARQHRDELRLLIERDVKLSFYELCFLKAAQETTLENKKLLQQFVEMAQTKYSVGKGLQQDVIKAQVELSKIMDELLRLGQLEATEKGKLNSLMNRLPQDPLHIPHGIQKTQFNFDIEQLQELSVDNRPLLKEAQALIARSMAGNALAQKEYYPDLNVGVSYGQREDSLQTRHPDLVSAFFKVRIPLWQSSKQSKKVSETSYRIEYARETYRKLKNKIFMEIKEATDQENKGARLLELIGEGIIPQARHSLESAMAGYSVDKVDFLTLLDNEATLFKWQIKYHRELTNYEKNIATLEYTVGKSIF
ncbi:MAG: hypothetical protein COV66_15530 [Nitrospinae bacterium CG11_big_fil_rev_8_21_14_0_20_45_15]|nr:MAG: hypothetical protein COV66_15530 [Nitrospinae bacterium CG11_big_fil_rev_8_21_14_0_20_45_15]